MGGSLKIVEVAKGSADLFMSLPPAVMHFWDVCGPHPILLEAFGKLRNAYGGNLDFSQKDTTFVDGVIGSNGIVHPTLDR